MTMSRGGLMRVGFADGAERIPMPAGQSFSDRRCAATRAIRWGPEKRSFAFEFSSWARRSRRRGRDRLEIPRHGPRRRYLQRCGAWGYFGHCRREGPTADRGRRWRHPGAARLRRPDSQSFDKGGHRRSFVVNRSSFMVDLNAVSLPHRLLGFGDGVADAVEGLDEVEVFRDAGEPFGDFLGGLCPTGRAGRGDCGRGRKP